MVMKNLGVACAVLAFASLAAADKQAITLNQKDVQWGEVPPDLPKGAQMAVLYGDPGKPAMFAVRLKMPDGYKIPPHWHTQDEQLTILSGTLVMHMGDTMKAEPHELTMGAFHFLPGKMHHGAEAHGETVVQLNGMGPFDIHYLNPADNPRSSKAASK
jgi:hypothetical protein